MTSVPQDYRLPGGGAEISALPKISLHDHLDGGLRTETIIELGLAAGLEVPELDPAELRTWFKQQANSDSLVEYLQTFELTIAVMQTADNLSRVAREFVQDLGRDGVIWGEVRWAPEQHLRAGLTLDQAVEAVQAGIEDGIDEVRHSTGHRIRVGQLLSAMRQNGDGLEIAELAVRHRNKGVAGFDIAGPEAGFPARNLQPAFDYVAEHYLPRTVHAGEADGLDSIRGALFDGRALRLGHGVRIAEDIVVDREDAESTYVALGRLSQWVKDREIALELSPTSNLDTKAIAQWGDELVDHPFDLLYQLGFRVTVNTDNRLMSATTLSRELSLLAETFDYDLGDLESFQLNAAAASFLPLEEREELADQIIDGFEGA